MPRNPGQKEVPVKLYAPLQAHFLMRLRDLKAKLDSLDPVAVEPSVQRALRRAIYTTLRDCIETGVGDEARAILQHDGTRARSP